MLAMQDGAAHAILLSGDGPGGGGSWPGWGAGDARANAQEKMKRLMDLPATDDLDWTRHDR